MRPSHFAARSLAALVALVALVTASTADAVDLRLGDILVTDQGALGGELFRVDPVTGVRTAISPGGLFSAANDVAIDAGGQILVVDRNAAGGTGAVIRVDPVTEAQTLVSSGQLFRNPVRIAIAEDGELFVVDSPGSGSPRLLSVDPVSGVQNLLASGGATENWFGLAIDTSGALLVANRDLTGGAAILSVPRLGGTPQPVFTGGDLRSPNGLALDAAGDVFVADSEALGSTGALFRLDRAAPALVTISSAGLFSLPFDVALEADGTPLVVDVQAFGTPGAVFRVDPTTGAQATVASGPPFLDPIGLAVVLPVPEVRSLKLPKTVRLRNAATGGAGSTVAKSITVSARIGGPYTASGEVSEATVSLVGSGGQGFLFEDSVPGVLVSTGNGGTAVDFPVTFDVSACDATPIAAPTTGVVAFTARVVLQSGAIATAAGSTDVICKP